MAREEKQESLESNRRAWTGAQVIQALSEIGYQLRRIGGKLDKAAIQQEPADLTVLEVDELLSYANKLLLSPGALNGVRRRATGARIISLGRDVLNGSYDLKTAAGSGRR